MFGYAWTERLTLIQPGSLADQPTNWFETILAQLGIPEILLLVAMGVIVGLVLDSIGQKAIGKMVIVVAWLNAASLFITRLAQVSK